MCALRKTCPKVNLHTQREPNATLSAEPCLFKPNPAKPKRRATKIWAGFHKNNLKQTPSKNQQQPHHVTHTHSNKSSRARRWWWTGGDLNPRPPECKSGVHTNWTTGPAILALQKTNAKKFRAFGHTLPRQRFKKRQKLMQCLRRRLHDSHDFVVYTIKGKERIKTTSIKRLA